MKRKPINLKQNQKVNQKRVNRLQPRIKKLILANLKIKTKPKNHPINFTKNQLTIKRPEMKLKIQQPPNKPKNLSNKMINQ